MEEFSARTRAANLAAMAAEPVDVLVIGGGIVGAWVALTAARRGYRTALVEKGDFASGTSGKTSRLIHGGLRYLQRFRIRVVRQAARERDVLVKIAPDLVTPLPFLIPVYRGRGPRGWQLRLGLWIYDALSTDRVLPRRKWLSREEVLGREPRLGGDGLLRGALYSDAITRDAQLVLAVVRAAAGAGALAANYARVTEILRDGGRVAGARVRDEETGAELRVHAAAVVNATGVWLPDLRSGDRLKLRPTKGVHVLVPRARVGNEGAVTLPTGDGRVIFVLPWGDLSLIGTTDTDYRGDRDRVEADAGDVAYLLDAVNKGFPEARLRASDVVGAYAGLRPLVDSGQGKESDISRRHRVIMDADGLVSVAGGKLTTARAMAADVLSRVGRQIPEKGSADPGGAPSLAAAYDVRSVAPAEAARLAARYEMALHLDDVLIRRLGWFYERGDGAISVAPDVAHALGEELGWDVKRIAEEVVRYHGFVALSRRWREGGS